jgi:hypothetical protein
MPEQLYDWATNRRSMISPPDSPAQTLLGRSCATKQRFGRTLPSRAMNKFVLEKLLLPRIWKKILHERLAEPIHLNLVAAGVALFGSFRSKVDFDLVVRAQHAFGLLQAADWAKEYGISRLSAIEFGVADGAGLLNICEIARKVTTATGVEFDIYGFDGGTGMPPPRDYRDHPEYYRHGDFPMQDPAALQSLLPQNAKLILGSIRDTVASFLPRAPIGFVSIDVDYYSSSVEALQILCGPPELYLPWIIIYLDDVGFDGHNEYCGELLAAREFVQTHPLRPITRYNLLRQKRIFQRAPWIDHMHMAHILDHPIRLEAIGKQGAVVLENPYLGSTYRS